MTNMDGNINPFTGEKIEQLEPEKWKHLNINGLYDVRVKLVQRKNQCETMKMFSALHYFNEAINTIDQLIYAKEAKSGKR